MILLGTVSFLLIMFDFYILQARAINNRTKISYKNKNIFSGLLERTKNHPTRFGICLFTACFIIIGLVLFHFAQNEDFEDMKNNFKKETGDSIKNDLRMETSLILENQKNIDDRRYYDFKKNYYDDLKKCILNFGFSYRCFKE